MTNEPSAPQHSIDSIVDQLDRFRQRATYGAVAAVLNRPPRNLMAGRSRGQKDSWIVSQKTGLPTGYEPDQVDPGVASRDAILASKEELAQWLERPV
ncbi:MAG: hypothetical protein M3Q09_07465 [Gemmatimonadota bacterium]|nr:hypothetical protein [Gemmatimonadota bacterium]